MTTLPTGISNAGICPTGARRGGFTLLELVMVLMLISVALAMMAPNLRGFRYGHQIDGQARELMALTRFARTQAVTQGTTYVIRATNIQVQSDAGMQNRVQWQATPMQTDNDAGSQGLGGMSLGGNNNGAPVDQADPEPLGKFTAEDGVDVQLVAPDKSPMDQMMFYPDGNMTPAQFHISGPGGEKWVTCVSRVLGYQIRDTDEMELVSAAGGTTAGQTH